MSSATSTCISRYSSAARLSRAGRHRQDLRAQELVYRHTRPLARPVPPPASRIIQNTVHQTVVHLHQTTHQHILNAMDKSRPALAARRLLRVLSTESARRTLRPFYRELFRELLVREREEYRGKPARSLLLVQYILGRRQTLTVLRRFYRETPEPEEAPGPREEHPKTAPPPAGGLSLSEAELQVLARGVADILGRQSRLDALRRGGM